MNEITTGIEHLWVTDKMNDFIQIGTFRVAVSKLDYYGLQRNFHPSDPQFSQKVLTIAISGREPLEIVVSQDAKIEDFLSRDYEPLACPKCGKLAAERQTGSAVDGLPGWKCYACGELFGNNRPH